MPIENAFGRVKQILEGRPTRTLKQLRFEVRRAWNSLPDAYFGWEEATQVVLPCKVGGQSA